MQRTNVLELLNGILSRQGKATVHDESVSLRDAGFRSLDFSELALRVEREVDRELNFDAAVLRSIATIADVLDFFVDITRT